MKRWIISFLCVLLLSTTATPTQAAAKKNWKNLYARYLKKLDPSGQAFPGGKFIYINNDSIPELYLTGNCAATGERLLTIYRNKVYDYRIDGHGSFSYVKKKNLLYISGGHMDNYFDCIAMLKKGKMVGLAGGCYGANNMKLKVDKKGNLIYRYYWIGKSKGKNIDELYYRDHKHGKRVTKKQYGKKLKKSLGKNRKKYIDAYSYGHMRSIRQIRKALK